MSQSHKESAAVRVVKALLSESDERLTRLKRIPYPDQWDRHALTQERSHNTTLHTVLGEIRRAERDEAKKEN